MKKTTVLSLLLLTAGMTSAQTLDYTIPSGQTLQFSTSPEYASVLRQDTSLSGHITLPDSITYWEMLYLPDSDVPYDSVSHTVPVTGIVVFASPNGCNAIINTMDSTLVAGCRSSSIPPMVRHIYSFAFQGIKGLRVASLPDSLKTIGNYAFAECDSLTAIHIPATVRHIGWFSFRQCPRLVYIDIAEDNPVYDSREGCAERSHHRAAGLFRHNQH